MISNALASHGLTLVPDALKALSGIPVDHALELIATVAAKVQSGYVQNASNYVSATIARGYVPESSGGALAASAARAEAAGGRPGRNGQGAAAALERTSGMQKALQAGLQLTGEAIQALLSLPTSYASELLEQVAGKAGSLRDPSNYIAATIAKGFVPKEVAARPGPLVAYSPHQPPPPRTPPPSAFVGGSAVKGGRYYPPAEQLKGDRWHGKGAAAEASPSWGSRGRDSLLVPLDLTAVEAKVLELNYKDHLAAQPLDATTLIALRCLPEVQALDLLGGLESKLSSPKGIANPNNYVQAAVVRIRRAETSSSPPTQGSAGKGSSKNFTGNQSRQKAAELGLVLDDSILELVARTPLKIATVLLEAAAQVQVAGQDPNEYLQGELAENGIYESGEHAAKRARTGQ